MGLIFHFLYGSLCIQSSLSFQDKGYSPNIPQLSYLCGLQTPGQMFNLLTTSLCSFKTIKYRNSRILPQHQLSPKPYGTDVFFSEICYFFSEAHHPTLVNPQIDTDVVFHQTEMVCGKKNCMWKCNT